MGSALGLTHHRQQVYACWRFSYSLSRRLRYGNNPPSTPFSPGPFCPPLIRFSLPLMLSLLLHAFYVGVDLAVTGHCSPTASALMNLPLCVGYFVYLRRRDKKIMKNSLTTNPPLDIILGQKKVGMAPPSSPPAHGKEVYMVKTRNLCGLSFFCCGCGCCCCTHIFCFSGGALP